MITISIVGIDNCGKTSLVKALNALEEVHTIHVTACEHSRSKTAKWLGIIFAAMARFSESRKMRILTGFVYLLHLVPYYFERNTKRSSRVLISDRDPIIDTLCYIECYLPSRLSHILKPSVKWLLERFFTYPTHFCYIEVSPEISLERNGNNSQLHDGIRSLTRLKELFDEELNYAVRRGIPVFKINSNIKSFEEVLDEVKLYLKEATVKN